MPAVAYPNIGTCSSGFGCVLSQSEKSWFRQNQHWPQTMNEGTTTRSPTLTFLTSGPVSTTSPMNSWPMMSPGFMVGR
jgi:hypothetical protein